MYLWIPLPERVPSMDFARDLLEQEGLAVLAGSVFGAGGEGFVRWSFIAEPALMRDASARIDRVLDRYGAGAPKSNA